MVGKVGQDVSGVRDTTMATLHVELQRCAPPLDSFLFWCIFNYGTDVSFPPSICTLFIALGKSSPVCALLPQLDSVESLYEKLKNDEPIKQFPDDLLLLQQACPLLFDVISTVEGDMLPSALTLLIKDLLEKAKALFHGAPFADSQSVHSRSFRENSWKLLLRQRILAQHLHQKKFQAPQPSSWNFFGSLLSRYGIILISLLVKFPLYILFCFQHVLSEKK